MVTLVDNRGREVSFSIFDAVFSPGRTIRTKKRAAKAKTDTAKVEAAGPVAEAGPTEAGPAEAASAPTEEAPTEPTPAEPTASEEATSTPIETTSVAPDAAATETPAETTAATVEVPAETPTEEVAAAASEEEAATAPAAEPSAEWTEEDNKLLIEMKAKKNSWKQIAAALPGKTNIKDHYKNLDKGKGKEIAGGKEKEKVEEGGAETAEAKGKEKGKQAAGSSKKPLRHVRNPSDWEEEKDEDDEDDSEEQGTRPVISVEDGSELSARELRFLFELHEYFEGIKWLQITSRFWDKTNHRIDPTELRRQLGDRQFSQRQFEITARRLVGREPPEHMVPKY